MADIIELSNYENVYYATCPECGSISWSLPLNGPAESWTKIVGAECSECGLFIKWLMVPKTNRKPEDYSI